MSTAVARDLSVCPLGGKVSEGKPLLLETENTWPLFLLRAALAGTRGKVDKAAATVLTLTIGGESHVLGTFRPGQMEQFKLNMSVHNENGKSYYLNVEGPGEVHILGETLPPDFDSDDDFLQKYGDADESIPSDLSSSEGDEALNPKTSIRIEELQEDHGDEMDLGSDEDDDELEGLADEDEEDDELPPPAKGTKLPAGGKGKEGAAPNKAASPAAGKALPTSAEKGKKRPADGSPASAPAEKKQKMEGPASGAHKCAQCEKVCNTAQGLLQHMKDKHKSE